MGGEAIIDEFRKKGRRRKDAGQRTAAGRRTCGWPKLRHMMSLRQGMHDRAAAARADSDGGCLRSNMDRDLHARVISVLSTNHSSVAACGKNWRHAVAERNLMNQIAAMIPASMRRSRAKETANSFYEHAARTHCDPVSQVLCFGEAL